MSSKERLLKLVSMMVDKFPGRFSELSVWGHHGYFCIQGRWHLIWRDGEWMEEAPTLIYETCQLAASALTDQGDAIQLNVYGVCCYAAPYDPTDPYDRAVAACLVLLRTKGVLM